VRFPAKLLADLGGIPVIVRVFHQARSAGLDRVLVATDHEAIEEVVKRAGGEVVRTEGDFRTGTDRIEAALRQAEGSGDPRDVVVNIQGDEPFIEPELIGAVARALVERPDLDMATAATPATPHERNDPNAVKVVIGHDGRALYFSRAAIPGYGSGYDAETEPATLRHLGLYAYRRDLLARFVSWPPGTLEQVESLEQLRAVERGIGIHVIVRPSGSFGIDTPADLERARRLLEGRSGSPA
jgi:3-deoxy-manno-octulosonate cytidylyltransferase (CMP-KDO synthetase)